MGLDNIKYALVVMSNKDTYYVTTEMARAIQQQVLEAANKFIELTDARTGSRVTLNIEQISSVVVRGQDNGVK